MAPLRGRPGERELGERLGALGRGVTGADRAVLGRAMPGALKAVERAVKVDLERGYDLGR
ncbi:hypothetical protein [Rubrivirga litoralis]|uniref:Uncharacterized protein n=1 Tax=Rubrivirga litoralis TaxID=3075598 RepID=A0ABU3BV70_9BACT|nr:hypothetical protein [Rubrivirga sp. F394]MDT0633191.1 hypothetical protein [Rubrivirga sp. F394]